MTVLSPDTCAPSSPTAAGAVGAVGAVGRVPILLTKTVCDDLTAHTMAATHPTPMRATNSARPTHIFAPRRRGDWYCAGGAGGTCTLGYEAVWAGKTPPVSAPGRGD